MADNKALAKKEEKEIVYEVGGNEIKLTQGIVKQFITRGNGDITASEAVNFMMWCSHNKLDPFNNEAYLVKFGSQAAQQLVGKAAFERRAETNPNYEGDRYGVILLRDNKIVEEQGAFKLPTDKLVGAWCEVYVKGRKYPVVAKVSFEEYNKGQSTWKSMPLTMIAKVARVQALRNAFPTSLGGLYTEDEIQPTQEESIKSTIQEVKQEIQEEPIETLDIPFDNIQEAEILENEQLDF
ncbi:phage recombination protein Bet [Clostridium sp.]|uniref:phage recombination protein Bet n=1 Tax=Clostridium sp. TaxID=1506 RepID=UPI00321720C4